MPRELGPPESIRSRLLMQQLESHALEQQLDRPGRWFVKKTAVSVALGDGINLSPRRDQNNGPA